MTPLEQEVTGNHILTVVIVIIVFAILFLFFSNLSYLYTRKRKKGITITKASRDNQDLLNK